MKESGISLDVRPEAFVSMIAELDYARRTPLFEGRRPPHAAIVLDGGSLAASEIQVEVVDLPYDLDTARHFVDGRAAYLLKRVGSEQMAVACFERPLQLESDLARLHRATGALIVQRTPLFEVVRVFADDRVVVWDGRHWVAHPMADRLMSDLVGVEELSAAVHTTLSMALELIGRAHV